MKTASLMKLRRSTGPDTLQRAAYSVCRRHTRCRAVSLAQRTSPKRTAWGTFRKIGGRCGHVQNRSWQGQVGSNHRVPESKSGALPLGYIPILRTLPCCPHSKALPVFPGRHYKGVCTSEELPPVERITGLEPVLTAWKAAVLPLHHIRISRHYTAAARRFLMYSRA